MSRTKTYHLTLMAVLTALSVILAFIHVPTPTGYLTLLDVSIYFTAYYLGSKYGAVVGGLSGFLIDLLLGYPQYMFHSLIAHGAQGYFAGWTGKKRILGLILASILMVGWYFLATFLLGYGLGGALAGIPGNLLQNLFGMLVGYLVYLAYQRFENK
ncbi:MAG: ECF transporter S component [Streptococcus lutetiensis]|nr:ECF transporter S component [Streptococcus lutetiensis]MDU1741411.1 ECF transporter S component [Streptococcus lutetiensis]MDU6826197.1 ECF transporter S component [Streptococcus lutetiensis]MDU6893619.1 ECF transporter S component [Streptococcus lutetiensis]